MNYYQKLERPVVNESDAIQLRFGLTLQQIMNVVRVAEVVNGNYNLTWEWFTEICSINPYLMSIDHKWS